MKNLPLSLAVSAVSGALTLLRPADWQPRTRRAFVLVPGVLVPATLAGALVRAGRQQSDADSPGGTRRPSVRARSIAAGAALALGIGSVVSGVQILSLRCDARMERWLVRRGARRPRIWMGAAVALVALAMDLLDKRGDGRGDDSGESAAGHRHS